MERCVRSRHITFSSWLAPHLTQAGFEAVSLLMRRALSSPAVICHWVLTRIGVLSGRFRAHLSCWRAAYQEYSQWAMSAPETSSGLLQRLVRELSPSVWCIELSRSSSEPKASFTFRSG